MTVCVTSAALVDSYRTERQPDGTVAVTLVEPMSLILFPESMRDAMKQAGSAVLPVNTSRLVAFLQFAGVEESPHHNVTWRLDYPDGRQEQSPEPLPFQWHAGSLSEPYFIHLNGLLLFDQSGVHWYSFYFDGREVARLPLLLCWRTEAETYLGSMTPPLFGPAR